MDKVSLVWAHCTSNIAIGPLRTTDKANIQYK